MATCNTAQKEIGGKELVIKACKAFNASTAATGTSITVTNHGAKPGDIIAFEDVGAITTIDVDTPTVRKFYIVLAIVDANNFTITATMGGTAIVPGAAETDLPVNLFRQFGGIRSKSFSLNTGAIDITNQDSDEWTNILDGAGVRSCSISGSGVYTNEEVYQDVLADTVANKLVCLMFIETKTFRIWESCFKVSSMEISGDYDAESNYSVSAESSGPVSIVKLSA